MNTLDALPLLLAALPQSVQPTLRPADVDGDGLVDVLRLEADGVSLARNLGGGRFAQPLQVSGPAADALWLDLDLDGDLDLVLCRADGLAVFDNRGALALVPVTSPVELGAARGVQAIDLDGDRLPDLHVVLAEGEVLLHNLGSFDFAKALVGGGASAATLGATLGGATSVGGLAAAGTPTGICAGSLFDMAIGGCITASSTAALGQLYPLSLDFNVRPSNGFVGMGTASPADRLHVVGVVRAQNGLRFGDGSLQTSAFDKQWTSLTGVPPGFLDGIDDDTLYSAGLGLTLAAQVFGFDTAFGDARYWNEAQSLTGDLSGTLGNAVVDGLQGRAVSSAAPATGQVLKWSGANWAPAADVDTNTTYSPGTGLALSGTTFSVAAGGVGATQLASDGASLSKVTGGTAQMTGGALRVNTTSTAGRLNVGHSSSTGNPQLQLVEQGASSFGRMQFSNLASPSSWTVAGGLTADAEGDRLNFFHSSAGDVLSISGESRVGVRTVNPLTALHVAGSLHLQGTGQDISVQSGEQFQLGHYDGSTFTERLRIDSGGTLHLGGDVLAPEQTRWLMLSASEFALVFRMGLESISGNLLYQDGGAGSKARAAVHLPHGATVTAIRARVEDSSPDADVHVTLTRQSFNSISHFDEDLALAASTGVSGGGITISTTSITNGVIDNQDFEYYVTVWYTGNPIVTGDVYFHLVQIEYQTPQSLR